MLNKEICKRCCQTIRKGTYSDMGWWDDSDDLNWSHGYVLCPFLFHFMSVKVEQPPREDCGYYMEQLVMNQSHPEEQGNERTDSMGQEGKPE